jgi:hypothetical protein
VVTSTRRAARRRVTMRDASAAPASAAITSASPANPHSQTEVRIAGVGALPGSGGVVLTGKWNTARASPVSTRTRQSPVIDA